ncbi:hypothetical protein [Mycolicibacterium thermoresistibile]
MATTADPNGPDRIDDVAAGDIVLVDRGGGQQACKVVHKDSTDDGYLVTFEVDDGTTFQLSYPAGTCVVRSMQAKWESAQSVTGEA